MYLIYSIFYKMSLCYCLCIKCKKDFISLTFLLVHNISCTKLCNKGKSKNFFSVYKGIVMFSNHLNQWKGMCQESYSVKVILSFHKIHVRGHFHQS